MDGDINHKTIISNGFLVGLEKIRHFGIMIVRISTNIENR